MSLTTLAKAWKEEKCGGALAAAAGLWISRIGGLRAWDMDLQNGGHYYAFDGNHLGSTSPFPACIVAPGRLTLWAKLR
jgi:hypothetical protein